MESKIIFSEYSDFTFNFYQFTQYIIQYEDGKGDCKSQIRMSPEVAKLLHKTLGDNIEKYEELYGEIKTFTEEMKAKEKEELEKKMRKMEELEIEKQIEESKKEA